MNANTPGDTMTNAENGEKIMLFAVTIRIPAQLTNRTFFVVSKGKALHKDKIKIKYSYCNAWKSQKKVKKKSGTNINNKRKSNQVISIKSGNSLKLLNMSSYTIKGKINRLIEKYLDFLTDKEVGYRCFGVRRKQSVIHGGTWQFERFQKLVLVGYSDGHVGTL